MLKNERELQFSFETIAKLQRIRDGYMKAIPESQARDAFIDGLDIQIHKIEKEIFEYLQKRQEKEHAGSPCRQTNNG